MKGLYLTLLLNSLAAISMAQVTGFNTNGTSTNAITTAVPFLTISPDARAGGMGDAGAATSPDANATYWNPAKLAFITDAKTISLSYSPWMRHITSDVNLAYLSYINKLDDRNTIAASLRYFNLGKLDSYDDNLNSLGSLHPNEFSFDVSLARKYGENLSLGLTARYIRSDVSQGTTVGGQTTSAGNAVAADASLYYNTPTASGGSFAFGADISNIGTKMSYTNGEQYFLPTNLRLGVANTFVIDDLDEVTFALDVNKLLVPTPPIRDANGNIIAGRDDNRSVVSGIFGSFTDAPGGMKEELQEISFSPAMEYWYQKQFALRAGYFYENPNKGGRQYVTLGLGYRSSDLKLDFSYLVSSVRESDPLQGVVKLSVGYSFGSK